MSKLKTIGALVVAFILGMILAFYLCANDTYNPFHELFQSGSGHGVSAAPKIQIETKELPIAPIKAKVIIGRDLTKAENDSLHRSHQISNDAQLDATTGDIPSIPVSPCPTAKPFAFELSQPWYQSDLIKVTKDSSVMWSDSGTYFIKGIADPDFRMIRDFEFSSTPLHPITIEKTNTLIINPEKAIDYYAGVSNNISLNSFGLCIGASLPSELLPVIHPKHLSLDGTMEYFFTNSVSVFNFIVRLLYHF